MELSLNTQKILREKRIISLRRDIAEITRLFQKEDDTKNIETYQRRINEKQELVNILVKQNANFSK